MVPDTPPSSSTSSLGGERPVHQPLKRPGGLNSPTTQPALPPSPISPTSNGSSVSWTRPGEERTFENSSANFRALTAIEQGTERIKEADQAEGWEKAALRESVAVAERDKAVLRKDKETAEQEIARLKEVVRTAEQEKVRLMEEAEKEKAELRKTIRNVEQENTELRKDKKMAERERVELIETAEQEKQELETAVKQKDEELRKGATAQGTIAFQKKHIKRLWGDLDATHERWGKDNNAHIREKKEMASDLEGERQLRRKAEQRADDLQQRNAALQAELEAKEEQQRQSKEEFDTGVRGLQAEVSSQDKELAKARQEAVRHMEEHEATRLKLSNEVSRLQENESRLRTELAAATEQANRGKERVAEQEKCANEEKQRANEIKELLAEEKKRANKEKRRADRERRLRWRETERADQQWRWTILARQEADKARDRADHERQQAERERERANQAVRDRNASTQDTQNLLLDIFNSRNILPVPRFDNLAQLATPYVGARDIDAAVEQQQHLQERPTSSAPFHNPPGSGQTVLPPTVGDLSTTTESLSLPPPYSDGRPHRLSLEPHMRRSRGNVGVHRRIRRRENRPILVLYKKKGKLWDG